MHIRKHARDECKMFYTKKKHPVLFFLDRSYVTPFNKRSCFTSYRHKSLKTKTIKRHRRVFKQSYLYPVTYSQKVVKCTLLGVFPAGKGTRFQLVNNYKQQQQQLRQKQVNERSITSENQTQDGHCYCRNWYNWFLANFAHSCFYNQHFSRAEQMHKKRQLINIVLFCEQSIDVLIKTMVVQNLQQNQASLRKDFNAKKGARFRGDFNVKCYQGLHITQISYLYRIQENRPDRFIFLSRRFPPHRSSVIRC
eukprot:TRINITY_DN13813_c0_g1_i1.p2 TRINITY_DN13813_c0_g1~~TRINITY_DN13813_c0_g1_i1.p2  ORF type:complete len:251 (-),score=-13.94 TRINITY_DN13813_c0_g1_i1:666-1418(-)